MPPRLRDYAPRGPYVILPGDDIRKSFDDTGAHRVIEQSHTELLLDVYLTRKLSTATLAAPAVVGSRTFTVQPGHTIAVGNYLEIWYPPAFRWMQARVTGVAGNTITLELPADVPYPTTSIIDVTTSQLAVDGSVTPLVYTFAPKYGIFDMTRVIAVMIHSTEGDDSKWGNLPALTNGVWSRYASNVGAYFNVWNVRTNGDLKLRSYDTAYRDKAGGGSFSTAWTRAFGGPENNNIVFRFDSSIGGRMELYIRDNISALLDFKFVIQGHMHTAQDT